MTNSSASRCCPVCESAETDRILPVGFELFDGHPMKGGYDLVQCAKCGFIFANTCVTQDQLDKYYADLSKYEDKTISTGGGFTQNDKDRLFETALFLNKHIERKDLRIVDLGCANGGMLRELKQVGFTNLVGIDPSLACVEITRQEVGCDCYQHSLFDIPDTVGKFDVVILSHVLEHVLNVRQTIEIVEKLLNKNGILYLECPNVDFYYEVIHAPLQEFNAEHINHFNEHSFRNLMESFGFSVITTGDKTMKIASDQDYHAVFGLFRKGEAPGTSSFPYPFDSNVRARADRYISDSERIFGEIRRIIRALPGSGPLGLFGIGQFAFKLLRSDAFSGGRACKLFDNNRMNVGKKVNGVTILHGDELVSAYRETPFPIVISSLIHEKPIRKGIEDLFARNGMEAPQIVGFAYLLDQSGV